DRHALGGVRERPVRHLRPPAGHTARVRLAAVSEPQRLGRHPTETCRRLGLGLRPAGCDNRSGGSSSRDGETVDAADLKSAAREGMRVRAPLPAPTLTRTPNPSTVRPPATTVPAWRASRHQAYVVRTPCRPRPTRPPLPCRATAPRRDRPGRPPRGRSSPSPSA